MDVVYRRALASLRERLLSETRDWLEALFGHGIGDEALYRRALTHSSESRTNYERLEFLGDRILGVTVAEWLFTRYPEDPEGALSRRFNALVSGETCADIARRLNVAPHMKLGKQARDDGASDSDNILGDVVESLIAALHLDRGPDASKAFIRTHWAEMVEGQRAAPRHPKSALQEWAAAHKRKAPHYEVVERDGPHHAPRFTVRVSIPSAGEAEAQGKSKQEAEKAAAEALLGTLERS